MKNHQFEQSLADLAQQTQLLQLATVGETGTPWICTVYFVIDEANNVYWLSFPTRRHSLDIAHNKHIAATIVVKADLPVIGIQLEGTAERVTDLATVKKMSDAYVAKYDSAKTFYDRFVAGNNQHVMYMLKPSRAYLFDELATQTTDRQEIVL